MEKNLPGYIISLLSPHMYQHPVDRVDLVQTHSSYVLLAGQFVYKFKKKVDFGFLDFSTFDKRRYYCQQELILNRRLCPDIYLDVVPVTRKGAQYYLNGPGTTVEHGVFMKRLPEEKMMTSLLSSGRLTVAHLDRIAETLIPFYQNAEQNEKINQYGSVKAITKNIKENFDQIKPFINKGVLTQKQYADLESYTANMLRQEDLFNARIGSGCIHDCHGDLHSANICIDERVHIYDCIEFNSRLRYGDIAADIGFLAMDLDFNGLTDFADHFVDQYCLGANDKSMHQVLFFYKCYRAVVRGKIGLFTANDPAVEAAVREKCLDDARRYFELAQFYTHQ